MIIEKICLTKTVDIFTVNFLDTKNSFEMKLGISQIVASSFTEIYGIDIKCV